MYKKLPIEALVPNRENPNRMSRMLTKKLKHNIEQLSMYETLTVRPHPQMKGKFEILNGHSRLDVLRALGSSHAKCEIWKVDDAQTRLYLAILNKLSGSDAPELRMNLLFKLMEEQEPKDLSRHIPETAAYLAKLRDMAKTGTSPQKKEPAPKPDVVIVNFYLNSQQHNTVTTALHDIAEKYNLSDSSQALAKLAQLHLDAG